MISTTSSGRLTSNSVRTLREAASCGKSGTPRPYDIGYLRTGVVDDKRGVER